MLFNRSHAKKYLFTWGAQNTQTSYSVVGDHEENNKQTIIPQRQKAILQINKRNKKKTRNNIIYSINAVLDLL